MTGFINIYKEKGVGSTFVVNRIKRLTKTSAGHMGTLDPLASGVLPVAIGNAARLFDYFLRKEKTYLARFRFGITTDTLDEEGEKISGGRVPGEAEINAALPAFFGEIEQVPPKYSAVSVGGRRGYELARAGADFNLQAKKVRILSFECTGQTAPDEYAFEIVCGGGTYIRSLARDLAVALGTQGYMSALERTASGVFTKEGAVTLNELTPENIAEKYFFHMYQLQIPSFYFDPHTHPDTARAKDHFAQAYIRSLSRRSEPLCNPTSPTCVRPLLAVKF